MHVLITGAPGAGTSTLAARLASRLDARWLEADDFYWQAAEVSFTQKKPPAQRRAELSNAMSSAGSTVIAGSVMGWGERIEQAFARIVFVYVDTETRLARLRERERRLYGCADPAFLDWAASYDRGGRPGRSLARHETWLAGSPTPVLRLINVLSIEDACHRAEAFCRDTDFNEAPSPERFE